jgi:hypothetical protein
VKTAVLGHRAAVAVERAQLMYRMSLLIILYMMHPMIALDVMSALRCVEVPGTGTSYVQTDLTVSCSTASYAHFRIVAALYMVVYIAGAIFAVTVAVYNNDIKILHAKSGTVYESGLRYVYFVKGYTDECYLFELAVMGRKLGIVLCSAMLSVGLQLVWASIIVGLSLAYTVMKRPYSSVLVNRLDTVALCALLVTLVLGFHSIFIRKPAANIPIFVVLVLVNAAVFLGLFFIALSKVQKKLRVLVNGVLAYIDERMRIDDDVDISTIQMTTRTEVARARRPPPPPPPTQPLPARSSSSSDIYVDIVVG